MVKVKNILILLLTLVFFLNSPAYPKGIKVSYLPYDTTMESVSKDYTNPDAPNKGDSDYDRDFIVLPQIDPGDCADDFKGIAPCRKCAKWRKGCPDCCLTTTDSSAAIRCTAGDESGDYACTDSPFQDGTCSKIECDDSKEEEKCELAEPICSGGTISEKSYRLYGKGCPKKDSDDLTPDPDCKEVAGSGLERVWECRELDEKPKGYPLCNPDLSSGLSRPEEYYSVVRADTSCISNPCKVEQCQVSCATKASGECRYANSSCSPSCAPDGCNSFIETTDALASAACTALGCGVNSSCSAACTSGKDSCAAGKCGSSSNCSLPDCKSYSGRWSGSPPDFYIYTLTQDFKDYLTACNDYADVYEECEDRITCCQENVCPDENKTGFEANCTKGNKCEDRAGCIKIDFCDEAITEGQCIANVGLAAGCLNTKETDDDANNDLSQEIPSGVRYSFIARSGESLIIDWNVVLDSLDNDEIEEMEGISFYTFVRVEEVGGANAPAPHISALTIRDMDNAFSIYGLTNVPAEKLTPGKKYEVKIYYFFPQSMECKYDNSESEYKKEMGGDHTVKVKQLYLNVVKVKE